MLGKRCDERLGVAGFCPVPNWPGCYVHKKLHAFLTVYVDDFKLACSERHAENAWKAIRGQLQLEDPTPLERYLGCEHIEETGFLIDHTKAPGQTLPRLSEDLRDKKLLPGSGHEEKPLPKKAQVRALHYDMVSFVDQCVDAYRSLAGPDTKPLQKVATPFLDESTAWAPPEGEPTGALKNVALSILMKILYAARMARPDI